MKNTQTPGVHRPKPPARNVYKSKGVAVRRRIAKVAFDTEATMAQFVRDAETHAGFLNHFSKQAGLGVVALVDKRRTYFKEDWPGALAAAERSDEGMVGAILRWMRSTGCFSESEQVQDAIERRVRGKANSEIRRDIRKARGTKAVRRQEAALDELAAIPTVRSIVLDGDARIDRGIRASFDCRDIPVSWPKGWRAGLPIPEPAKS